MENKDLEVKEKREEEEGKETGAGARTGARTGAGTGAGTGEGRKNREQKKENESPKEQYRVVINEEANTQLEAFLKKASEGNEPVNINKSDLANYIFYNLGRLLNESDIRALRIQHFDERKVLKGLLKRVESDSELPEELRRALRDYYGVSERDKKRAHKGATIANSEK